MDEQALETILYDGKDGDNLESSIHRDRSNRYILGRWKAFR